MDLLKEIGAILGFVAFGGLAILTFLTFQQARHLRRLRDWAGRQPERAAAEAEAVAERAGEVTIPSIDRDGETKPSRLDRLRGEASVRFEEIDRRSPVNPLILLAGVLAVVIGVGVATSGFGLIGEGSTADETTSTAEEPAEPKLKVAVLNGTTPEAGGEAVPEVADSGGDLVKELGYKKGAIETAPGSFPVSLVMFEEGSKAEATALAADLDPALGPTEVELISTEIQDLADGAPLALVIGIDDSGI